LFSTPFKRADLLARHFAEQYGVRVSRSAAIGRVIDSLWYQKRFQVYICSSMVDERSDPERRDANEHLFDVQAGMVAHRLKHSNTLPHLRPMTRKHRTSRGGGMGQASRSSPLAGAASGQ